MSLLEMSLSAAVLIAAIIIIRALLINHLPKKTFLVLWMIALLRLFVPFSIPSMFSVFTLADRLETGIAPVLSNAVPTMNAATGDVPVAEAAPMASGTQAVAVDTPVLVWMIGMAAVAAWLIVAYLKCGREFKMSLPAGNAYAAQWLEKHPLKRKIEVRISDKVSAPLTYGILNPVILLPKAADHGDRQWLDYVLAHEFIHIRRMDALTKIALCVALCVHWFNPLVWAMYVLCNRDLELSCDEEVIRMYGAGSRQGYAMTLIGMQEKNNRPAPLTSGFSRYAIEERIKAVMKTKKTTLIGVLIAILVIAGTTTAFATSAKKVAEDSPNEAVAYAEEYSGTPEELAAEYKEYEPFGLTYDMKGNLLYFNGKPVRFFMDVMSSNGEPLGKGEFSGCMRSGFFSEDGVVDVYTVRDFTKLDSNGFGRLTDIKAYTQAEFDARTTEEEERPATDIAMQSGTAYASEGGEATVVEDVATSTGEAPAKEGDYHLNSPVATEMAEATVVEDTVAVKAYAKEGDYSSKIASFFKSEDGSLVIGYADAAQGSVMVKYTGDSDKVMVLVYYDDGTKAESYEVSRKDTWQSIPLSHGSGDYRIEAWEHVGSNVGGRVFEQLTSKTISLAAGSASAAN